MSSALQGQPSGESATKGFPNQETQRLPQNLAQVPWSQSSQSSDRSYIVDMMPLSSLNQRPETLLPAFPNKNYNNLPTPQSPNHFGHYVADPHYSPESSTLPGMHTTFSPSPIGSRVPVHRHMDTQSAMQQTLTPESSPHAPHGIFHHSSVATLRSTLSPSTETASTPRLDQVSTSIKIEPLQSPPSLSSAYRIATPSADRYSPRLSSPFIAKFPTVDRNTDTRVLAHSHTLSLSPEPRLMQIDDVFSTLATSSTRRIEDNILPLVISTPPTSPPVRTSIDTPAVAGGEMERIRQAMMQDRLAHFQEAESRRPEYLKRAKRSLMEADPTAFADDESVRERERVLGVGIMESPNKGRRLKLFQETSEESFEESLMAGGYGRYRTADWVRQPHPLVLPTPGPSNVVSLLEETQEAPPSEKEIRKRKRLAAFRTEPSSTSRSMAKLVPVELEGKGRVLLDVPDEEQSITIVPESTPTKKRGGNRRKKRGAEPSAKDKALADAASTEGFSDRPNWPDAEFPWRMRTEERAEFARIEREEKMQWIERFLDRDTDDEDDGDAGTVGGEHEEIMPSAKWGLIYEDDADRPIPLRRGRGKLVPLIVNPNNMKTRRKSLFPSDPADAQAALLSKKSVRTLSYRQHRRQRETDGESDEELVCICHGRDDGRELVQCDGCKTWYHLQCIGIQNIFELGKEEDPWFCQNCDSRSSSLELQDVMIMTREPTFVPTDNQPSVSHSYDPPFFQPSLLQDSPMTWNPPRVPKTPPRSGNKNNHDLDPGLSSSPASWVGSSRHGPSTPPQSSRGMQVYAHHPPGSLDTFGPGYDESPFDPTSTPSRGIKFGAPFTTPKNALWPARANGTHTPLRPAGRGSSSKKLGGPGSLSSLLDDSGGVGGFTALGKMPTYDESPIRRDMSSEGSRTRRVLEAPLVSRSFNLLPPPNAVEDPLDVRSLVRETLDERGRVPVPEAP